MRPRHTDELIAALGACRELGVPVTMRGAGTSIAGNAVGPGVVLDTSRHLRRIVDIDAEAGTATVEPGVVHADLQVGCCPSGGASGPTPRPRAVPCVRVSGRRGDRKRGRKVGDGGGGAAGTVERLQAVIADDLATVRTEFGRFSRQVSGYSLEHLLPENGADVARFLVGSEGTLATVLRARVRLVRDAPARTLVALGYPSMAEAADAVPAILRHAPVACEGLDRRIVDVVRARHGDAAVPGMPRGAGWLLVEVVGGSPSEAGAVAVAVVRDSGALDARVVDDPGEAAALWRIRAAGAGLSSRTPSGAPAHAGWEDAAVPPERLGSYLRAFDDLLDQHRLTGLPYGHLGDGCLHIRIDFPFDAPEGREVFRRFLRDAAELAAAHGGSMSGEHGDGRARSELLPVMYSPAALALFERVKDVFDPQRLLNPGVLVEPDPADAAIRVAQAGRLTRAERPTLVRALREDRGDLSMAVHRCTGVGSCRSEQPGAAMCPSFRATREEKDSTRGRARVLQDVVAGHLGPDGWDSPALRDALDLCLSCKACASDCPTGVDLAAYRSEALHQRYRGRLRPRTHYALGWLPTWTRLLARMPWAVPVVNRVLASRWAHRAVTAAAGVDARRRLPRLAAPTFRRWFAMHRPPDGDRSEVVLFVDTFTDAFSPEVGEAAVAVLEGAGYAVRVTERAVCCGLTWVSTGQLGRAAAQARATVRELLPHVRAGAARRRARAVLPRGPPGRGGELPARRRGGRRGGRGRGGLRRPSSRARWRRLTTGGPGWDAEPHLAEAGAVDRSRGAADSRGVERGHHDVSVAVAGAALLPAVGRLDGEGPDGVVLADGFSCRTQLADLAGRDGEHLAQLLARHTPGLRAPSAD